MIGCGGDGGWCCCGGGWTMVSGRLVLSGSEEEGEGEREVRWRKKRGERKNIK